MSKRRKIIMTVLLVAAIVILFPACLLVGSVDIPLSEVAKILVGDQGANDIYRVIVIETRLPMALTAILAGAALSIAGLMLQTTFNNHLADPSILGISTGSSLGVAIVMLLFGGVIGTGLGSYVSVLTGAIVGAAIVMAVLLAFSTIVRNSLLLLIIGIMISYLASSAISLLNFFSTQEGVHSFVIWGLGNFSGITLDRLPVFAVLTLLPVLLSFALCKPLNALLLGTRYAENLGVNIRATRNWLITISSLLTAVVTAFCGPIGFIGLMVPHMARLMFRTSNHSVLLPATALSGSVIALLCCWISSLSPTGTIPINAITPIIAIPVIVYIIINRKNIFYFN
ncbi:MAG: iron ABC transporter permease [Muribaculaceae bacterium]|nr:iron ABC transporter permease [Muribaculaceae bacterium]MBR5436809.1 iron ABC transporter permease [Muribaculaceae bacterium]